MVSAWAAVEVGVGVGGDRVLILVTVPVNRLKMQSQLST